MGKTRSAISNEQKAALRAFCCTNPQRHEYKHLNEWFQRQYGRTIARSSLSETLSSRYNNLDTPTNTRFKAIQDSKRRRVEKWPELEATLYEWTLRMEQLINITSDILKEKAIFFFGKIPIYKGLEMPHFSNGWLMGFKSRQDRPFLETRS